MSTWKRSAGLVGLCTLMVGVSTTSLGWAAAGPVSSSPSLKSIPSAAAADQFDLAHLSTKRLFDPVAPRPWLTSQAQSSSVETPKASRGIVRLQASSGRSAVADLTMATAADPSMRVMWAASREGVDLSWAALSGVSEYRVSKGGKLLAVVRGTHYRDQGVLPGAQIQYIVQSVNPAKAVANSGRTWGLSVSVPTTSSSDALGMQAAAARQVAAAAAITYSTALYETFIPQKYISVPPGCSYFGNDFTGDNRSWGSGPGNSYKTWSAAVVDWNRGATVSSAQAVGASHVVNRKTKKVIATKTASTSGMSITVAKRASDSVTLAFRIKATIPFCTGFPKNSIEANFNLVLTRSGMWIIPSGWHKLMPNHQLWLMTNKSGWTRGYYRGLVSPICLLDAPFAKCKGDMGGFWGFY